MADEEKEKKVKGDQPDTSIKVTILKTDMSEEMVADIVTVTQTVIKKHKLHKDLATAIKTAFDIKHPPADNKATSGVWHCVCGSNFAVSVTHETHFACYWEACNVKMLLCPDCATEVPEGCTGPQEIQREPARPQRRSTEYHSHARFVYGRTWDCQR